MKLIIVIPKVGRKILDLEPTIPYSQAVNLIAKEFDMLIFGTAKLSHQGKYLQHLTPFIELTEYSYVFFHIDRRPHRRNPFHQINNLDLFDYQEEEYEEEDETDMADEVDDNQNLYTQEQVARFVENGDLGLYLHDLVGDMHLEEVMNERNSIYNRIDELGEVSNLIQNNASNFVPVLHTHMRTTGVSELSDEQIFDRMCAILDVDNTQADVENEDCALVESLTARQRSAVGTLLQQGIELHQAIETLRRHNFDPERALSELNSIEID